MSNMLFMSLLETIQSTFLPKGFCLTCCYPNGFCFQNYALPLLIIFILVQVILTYHRSFNQKKTETNQSKQQKQVTAFLTNEFIDLEDDASSFLHALTNSADDRRNGYNSGLNKKKMLGELCPDVFTRMTSEEEIVFDDKDSVV